MLTCLVLFFLFCFFWLGGGEGGEGDSGLGINYQKPFFEILEEEKVWSQGIEAFFNFWFLVRNSSCCQKWDFSFYNTSLQLGFYLGSWLNETSLPIHLSVPNSSNMATCIFPNGSSYLNKGATIVLGLIFFSHYVSSFKFDFKKNYPIQTHLLPCWMYYPNTTSQKDCTSISYK